MSGVFFAMLGAFATAAELAPELEKVREKYGLPALAAAAARGVEVTESAAVGVRKMGAPDRVTLDDQWHLGSCTKSMTATLAAMLIERGKLTWQSTIGETFPELNGPSDPQWAGVTLEQLVTQRSGMPATAPPNLWRNAGQQRGTPGEQRLEFAQGLLLRRPEAAPGTKFIYSNQNYAVAGAMLERITGEPWEKLLAASVFQACGMTTAGFGAPATPGKTDQPWGHRLEGEAFVPVPPGPKADNPPAIGPANAVHCTIAELARYAAWHGRGHVAGTATLPHEAFVKLHTPPAGSSYAMGWIATQRPWADGLALWHNGSNTMFYAVMWIAPAKGVAYVAATNCPGERASKACDEAVSLLAQRSGIISN